MTEYKNLTDSELVVLALGRFGGGELTAQSDLDLVFTFTGSFESVSDGKKPLSASAWCTRTGQRLIAALTVLCVLVLGVICAKQTNKTQVQNRQEEEI